MGAGAALKSFIPGTARYSQKHHIKYLQKKARGHDTLLLVEWEDGKLTELGADIHPEMNGWYQATNNLIFAPAGEGADPVDYYGVPVIRCHAQIACPFSTSACLAAEYDEAGEFRYDVNREENTTDRVVEVEMDTSAPTPGDATNGHTDGEAATDGGGTPVRKYDLQPPAGAVGHTFSLTQAKQRAPNAISANMVRRAVEYGKEKARQEGLYMKGLLHGGGLVLGTLIVIALLYIVGGAVLGGGGGSGGSGGGSGGVVFGSLLLASTARFDDVRDEVTDELAELYESTKADPWGAVLGAVSGLLSSLTIATGAIGYTLAMLTGGIYFEEYLSTHPEIASTEVVWLFGDLTPIEVVLGDLFTIALLCPPLLGLYLTVKYVRTVRTAVSGGDADAGE